MGALKSHGVGTASTDVELRTVGENTQLATVNLAFNRSFRKGEEWQQETSFVKTLVWGKRAEKFAEVVRKGQHVYVDGYLRQENWTTKDGNKRSTLSFVVEEWQLAQKFGNGKKNATTSLEPKVQEQAPVNNEAETVAASEGVTNDSDLPF